MNAETKVKLSELEALTGQDPSEVYNFANTIGFKVVAWPPPFPRKLFYDTLYFYVDDDDFVEKVWCNEKHLSFGE